MGLIVCFVVRNCQAGGKSLALRPIAALPSRHRYFRLPFKRVLDLLPCKLINDNKHSLHGFVGLFISCLSVLYVLSGNVCVTVVFALPFSLCVYVDKHSLAPDSSPDSNSQPRAWEAGVLARRLKPMQTHCPALYLHSTITFVSRNISEQTRQISTVDIDICQGAHSL